MGERGVGAGGRWEVPPAAQWGVVLVPTVEGRALLADAPCGGRPPAVRWMPRMDGGRGRWIEPAASRAGGPGSVIALPLWWNHVLVPDGWDRARRVWAAWDGQQRPFASLDPEYARAPARFWWPCLEEVLAVARALESAGLCRVAVLDLVDGAVRERAT